MEVTINPALLSPSSLRESISATTSCGTRTVKSCDFAFLLEVAITDSFDIWCVSVYAKKSYAQCLKCVSLKCSFKNVGETHLVNAKPGSAGTHTGPLTTAVNVDNEAAMQDHITHPQGRNNYTWRFLAINRHDRKAKPCRLSVEAATEHEARRILAPHFILSLAARLPLVGMAEINMPICVVETETQEVRHV
ncbi:host cell division inhibitor Icd-like protein [Pectobacterium polaris]|nr:host cell division inhibitor Icd-like protein [Pectobacterium polaris]